MIWKAGDQEILLKTVIDGIGRRGVLAIEGIQRGSKVNTPTAVLTSILKLRR
jgi:hypothetical protein